MLSLILLAAGDWRTCLKLNRIYIRYIHIQNVQILFKYIPKYNHCTCIIQQQIRRFLCLYRLFFVLLLPISFPRMHNCTLKFLVNLAIYCSMVTWYSVHVFVAIHFFSVTIYSYPYKYVFTIYLPILVEEKKRKRKTTWMCLSKRRDVWTENLIHNLNFNVCVCMYMLYHIADDWYLVKYKKTWWQYKKSTNVWYVTWIQQTFWFCYANFYAPFYFIFLSLFFSLMNG